MPRIRRDAPTTYIACCSFGKDSLATILLAIEHNEPLDYVVFCEVMFDNARGISGEPPEQAEWIHNVAIPKLEAMGVKVVVLRGQHDYISCFTTRKHLSGQHEGKAYGYVKGGHCWVNRDMKMHVLRHYYTNFERIHEYVGIAADEQKRLAGLKGSNKIHKSSLLAKYNVTEAEAMAMCEKAGLRSPLYDLEPRSGCWFCPTKRMSQYSTFRKKHSELWQELGKLGELPNLSTNKFHGNETFKQFNERIDRWEARS